MCSWICSYNGDVALLYAEQIYQFIYVEVEETGFILP